jgi:membrane protein implicated in regulation of membrane protease activity
MSAFPLILLGHYDTMWSRVILACGWAFLIWGIYFYLWSFVLYAVQVVLVMRRLPPVREGREKPMPSKAETDG